MSLLAKLKSPGPSGFGYGSTAEEVTEGLDLSGQTILLTGSNSGIGLETLRVLAMRGAHIIALARTEKKASKAILEGGAKDATPVGCELSDPASVRAAISRIQSMDRTLDAMVLNAGIMALPKLELVEGYEKQFFTNHIGHFLLTTGLLDQLSDTGRVVVVSSNAHRRTVKGGIDFENLDGSKSYNDWLFYGQSKLANLLFARELGRRFATTNDEKRCQTANSLHPGVIQTNLFRHMNALMSGVFKVLGPLGLKTIPQGAATQTFLAAHPDASSFNGEYFADSNTKESSEYGRDMELARRLWEKSEEIVANL